MNFDELHSPHGSDPLRCIRKLIRKTGFRLSVFQSEFNIKPARLKLVLLLIFALYSPMDWWYALARPRTSKIQEAQCPSLRFSYRNSITKWPTHERCWNVFQTEISHSSRTKSQ